MKISQLIAELEDFAVQFGDIEVGKYGEQHGDPVYEEFTNTYVIDNHVILD